ncbi:iron uptake porin [Pseudanabaena sp. BC1403]|uniref:iron uptake porin n=1 Tax=Pseudanabaena sp. BC1403 TaxID=2043171 RepID=UPI000CD82701|nr:iron uptake porin [Pseudanabaena sp. BC1403]
MILFLNKHLLVSMVSLLVNTIFSDQLLAYSFSRSELNKLSDITLRGDLKSFQISNSYIISNSKAESYSNVSQLLDVSHQDWDFMALQSIVNRYNCLTGYPNLNYRGDRNLTRYEFAAAIRACSDRLNQQLQTTLTNKISQADLLTLQKLQIDFATELSSLTNIVANLEAKTTNLESKSFSPTTKLNGVAIMSIATNYASQTDFTQPALDIQQNSIISNQLTPNTNVIAIARLNLSTSFSGEDLLYTRLEAGNSGVSIGSLLEQPAQFIGYAGFASSSGLEYGGISSEFYLGALRYTFPLGRDIQATIAPVLSLNDYFDLNSFSNDETKDFSASIFISNPLLLPVNDGTGGLVEWSPNQGDWTLRVGHITTGAGLDTSDPIRNINQGLFGDPYQAIAELEFAPKDAQENTPVSIRLQYTNGSVNNLDYNIGGLNLEWMLNKGFAVFGRYGFGSIQNRDNPIRDALPTYINANFGGNAINPQTWSLGLAFPDLFTEGGLGAIAIGQPFIDTNVGNATQTNLELFVKFPITSQITITPDLQMIFNPNNNNTNGSITILSLRTVFSF